MRSLAASLALVASLAPVARAQTNDEESSKLRKSIVTVLVTRRAPDLARPWTKQPAPRGVRGPGRGPPGRPLRPQPRRVPPRPPHPAPPHRPLGHARGHRPPAHPRPRPRPAAAEGRVFLPPPPADRDLGRAADPR